MGGEYPPQLHDQSTQHEGPIGRVRDPAFSFLRCVYRYCAGAVGPVEFASGGCIGIGPAMATAGLIGLLFVGTPARSPRLVRVHVRMALALVLGYTSTGPRAPSALVPARAIVLSLIMRASRSKGWAWGAGNATAVLGSVGGGVEIASRKGVSCVIFFLSRHVVEVHFRDSDRHRSIMTSASFVIASMSLTPISGPDPPFSVPSPTQAALLKHVHALAQPVSIIAIASFVADPPLPRQV